jgi:hypothetical protein
LAEAQASGRPWRESIEDRTWLAKPSLKALRRSRLARGKPLLRAIAPDQFGKMIIGYFSILCVALHFLSNPVSEKAAPEAIGKNSGL